MSVRVLCNTTADEIRAVLDDETCELVIEFELPAIGELHFIPSSVVGARRAPGGRDEVLCMLGNSHVVTLVLPSEDDKTRHVRLEGGSRVLAFIGECAAERAQQIEILALEEYLRWQEQLMLWGSPKATDDGPYAQHPRLYVLPAELRAKIAKLIAGGRTGEAEYTLRHSLPEFGDPDDAEDVVNALTFYV